MLSSSPKNVVALSYLFNEIGEDDGVVVVGGRWFSITHFRAGNSDPPYSYFPHTISPLMIVRWQEDTHHQYYHWGDILKCLYIRMYQYNHTPLYIFHKLLSVYSCLSDTQYDFIAIVPPLPPSKNEHVVTTS